MLNLSKTHFFVALHYCGSHYRSTFYRYLFLAVSVANQLKITTLMIIDLNYSGGDRRLFLLGHKWGTITSKEHDGLVPSTGCLNHA